MRGRKHGGRDKSGDEGAGRDKKVEVEIDLEVEVKHQQVNMI